MDSQLQMNLSRRERQIMEIIFRLGQATAAEVMAEMADSPSYSTVRALLRVLEEKGYVRHEQQGPRYVFLPTHDRENVKRQALKRLLLTFFNNSTEDIMVTLLSMSKDKHTEDELDRMQKMIEEARQEGR